MSQERYEFVIVTNFKSEINIYDEMYKLNKKCRSTGYDYPIMLIRLQMIASTQDFSYKAIRQTKGTG